MQKNKQELEILRHKVEHLQVGGGGSGTSYTKAQTNALLSEKADKSDTYTKAQTNSAISSAIGDIFADDPIVLIEDEETDKSYFPTDKVDILRLHKPFMYDEQVWYCCYDETGYGWIYFTITVDNDPVMVSEVHYMLILDETKEVKFDSGEAIERSEDLTAATTSGGTIDSRDGVAQTQWYLDRATTYLQISFHVTSNTTGAQTIISFANAKVLPWNPFQQIIAFKNGGSITKITPLISQDGFITGFQTNETFVAGDTISFMATCTVD